MEYEKQYKRIKQEAFEAILEGKNGYYMWSFL